MLIFAELLCPAGPVLPWLGLSASYCHKAALCSHHQSRHPSHQAVTQSRQCKTKPRPSGTACCILATSFNHQDSALLAQMPRHKNCLHSLEAPQPSDTFDLLSRPRQSTRRSNMCLGRWQKPSLHNLGNNMNVSLQHQSNFL